MNKGDLKREQILNTAEALFFSRGYDRTSVQDILDALHMSKGGLYHYFDAKESMLREICKRHWTSRFERLRSELSDARRSPMDRLNLLLRQANLFEAEDVHFTAMMLKLCYLDGDDALRAQRCRALVNGLEGPVSEVILEGMRAGAMHTRHPATLGRLLLMLACNVNDEMCDGLARSADSPDRMIRLIDQLNAYRESIELLVGAPYGSVVLFDPAELVSSWRAALDELNRLEE